MQPKGYYLITSQTGLRVIQGTPKSLHRQSLGVRDVWYTRFLTLCRMLQLKAYERAKTSANHAYSKSKALALQRLNSRNNQLLRGSVSGGSSVSNPQPSSAAATAAPPTPEAADDRASFPDDGKPPGANLNTSVRCTVSQCKSLDWSQRLRDNGGHGDICVAHTACTILYTCNDSV